MNDLVDEADLSFLAGGPFSEEEVDAAVAVLRAACGWHIAPVRDETITVDVLPYQRILRLPTLALVSVDEIRDMTADPDYGVAIDATTYDVSLSRNKVRRRGYWPHGYGALQVDISHGYASVPADLLPVISESATRIRRDQTATSMGAGPYNVQFGVMTQPVLGSPLATSTTLDRYLLHQPGMV